MYQETLDFWFTELEPSQWWVKDDQLIISRYADLHHQASQCERHLFDWFCLHQKLHYEWVRGIADTQLPLARQVKCPGVLPPTQFPYVLSNFSAQKISGFFIIDMWG
jgi:hypothetical protein